jgi:muconolactone delta-isomerase
MVAKSEAEVLNHIARFPLARYMKANVTELMFHHSAEFVMPEPSLN